MFALMIEGVHLLGIEIEAAVLIADEGIVIPTVPQAFDDIDELPRPPVTFIVLDMRFTIEVLRLSRIGGGHDVPSRAATAEEVKGGKSPCDVVRLVVSGCCGTDETDVARDGCKR